MTPFVVKLELVAYRGMAGLTLDELRPVTLIVGPNNSGKSSVLEAIGLALRAPDPGQWLATARLREADLHVPDGLWGLFPGGGVLRLEDGPQTSSRLEVRVALRDGSARTLAASCAASEDWAGDERAGAALVVDVTLDGSAPAALEFRRGASSAWLPGHAHRVFTVTTATHRSTKALVALLSGVVDQGRKRLAVDVLRLFDANVEDLDVVASLGREAVRVTHRVRGVADLATFGDGMRRAAALALALVRAAGGVLLVDELEVGIHPGVLGKVYETLVRGARDLETQVIATTHSLEAVDAMLACTADAPDALCAFWLERGGPSPAARRYDHARLTRMRESGLDVR